MTQHRIAGKWGYLDTRGQWAITPQYDEAGDFEQKELQGSVRVAALVRQGGRKFWIDPNGLKIIGALEAEKFQASSPAAGAATSSGGGLELTYTPVSPYATVKLGSRAYLFTLKANTQEWSFSIRCPEFRSAYLSISPGSGATRKPTVRVEVQPMNRCQPGTYKARVQVKGERRSDGHETTLEVPVLVVVK